MGKLLLKTQNLGKKASPVSQSTLELAAKGHKERHARRYSFGMVSIQEEDTRPEFNFGQDEEELEEIKNLISQFKKMPKYFPEHYLSALAFPKRENPPKHNGSYSQGPPPISRPLPPTFDTLMS